MAKRLRVKNVHGSRTYNGEGEGNRKGEEGDGRTENERGGVEKSVYMCKCERLGGNAKGGELRNEKGDQRRPWRT